MAETDLDDLLLRVQRLEALAADPAWLAERDVLAREVQEDASGGWVVLGDGRHDGFVTGETWPRLAANLIPDGNPSAIVRRNRSLPGAQFWVERDGTLRVQSVSLGDVFVTRIVGGPPSVEANGWQVANQSDGKRRWRKRWLGVPTVAATSLVVALNTPLPLGVPSLAWVDAFVQVRAAQASALLVAGLDGAEGTATVTLVVASTDGTNTNTYVPSVDVFVEMVER